MTRFAAIPSAAIEDTRLTGADLNVLAALGYHTCKDGWCWPSQDTIAVKARLSRQFVVESMKRLIRWGYVERYIENNNTRKIRYRVILDVANAPEEVKPQPVVTPVASPDRSMSSHTTGRVASPDRSCRVTRHKQEPSNNSKEQDAAAGLFEEVWAAWARKHKSAKISGRGAGKAKTAEIFKRKAAKTDPAVIRSAIMAFLAKTEAKFVPGLNVYLNQERYDSGDNVVAIQPTTLTLEEKLYAFENMGRWDASWGPKPVRQEVLL